MVNGIDPHGGMMLLAPQNPANDNGIFLYVVPRQPRWVFEVDGEHFPFLRAAEVRSKEVGKPIYCKLAQPKKATTR